MSDITDLFRSPSLKSWINKALSSVPDVTSPREEQRDQPATADFTESIGNLDDLQLQLSTSSGAIPQLPNAAGGLVTAASTSTSAATALEDHTSKLIHLLQLHSNELASRLDQLAEDAVRSVPRLMHDIELIRSDAFALAALVVSICKELDSAEQGVSHAAFDSLLRLETIRSRMESCRSALREAENWNTLTAELEAIFAAGDLERAGQRLNEASRSLSLLQGTPDHEERRKLLMRLQNQLEASLGPRLVMALSDYDAEAARKCFVLFEQIQRVSDFSSYYFKARKAPLLALWKSVESSKDFASSFESFTGEILAVARKESSWCPLIFPNATDTVVNLILQTFGSLKPNLSLRLEALVTSEGDDFLHVIIKTYMIAVAWGNQIETLLFFGRTVDPANVQGGNTVPTHPHSLSRRLSAAPSNSISQPPAPDVSTWAHPIFEAFLSFQQSYGALESANLALALSQNFSLEPPASRKAVNDCVRSWSDALPKLLAIAEGAIHRCLNFTCGFASVSLIEALNAFVGDAIDSFNGLLLQVRVALGIDEGGPSTATSTVLDGDDSDHEDSSRRIDRTQLDWSNFQIGLRVLGIAQNLTRRLRVLELTLIKALGRVKERVVPVPSNMSESTMDLFRSPPSSNLALEGLGSSTNSLFLEPINEPHQVAGQCISALSLLGLSTLNNYGLHQLVSSLDSERVAAVKNAPPKVSPLNDPSILYFLGPILPQLKTFTLASQRLLFDTIFSTLEKIFMAVPLMTEWVTPVTSEFPKFSLSQLPYITNVGEMLLTLPQRLEIHAGDDGDIMGFSIRGLPYLEEKDFVGDQNDDGGAFAETEESGEDEVDITHLWVKSISRAAIKSYLSAIMRIPPGMGSHACRQLAADAVYIIKVFEAIDVDPPVDIRTVAVVMDLSNEEFLEAWGRHVGKTMDPDEEVFWGDETLIRKLAALRAIGI